MAHHFHRDFFFNLKMKNRASFVTYRNITLQLFWAKVFFSSGIIVNISGLFINTSRQILFIRIRQCLLIYLFIKIST